ncbi:hypothetical protein K450DRAFT_283609 [Umbelopsis ramanniana AG]|uniref:Uncharacterized protein n=1 Tax=Umbelopsis ramanniana AG TaxID=1314678 RepID=A0AAD5E628_UMBRA|nr:uncharacterized protein K450DRAFT_283609 [Umbelopsis ramanniana AG]KAI8576310.1 hypothetical protein K450DRAFT_283609 [Umbelopsis ramanniana AG]
MSCFRRSNARLRILVPKDFDINSIQKCPIDSCCNFIPLDDDALKEEPDLPFVVLQQEYFIAHLTGRQFKCDYNCRNIVLSKLYGYRTAFLPYRAESAAKMIDNNFGLEIIHDTLHNNEIPRLIFAQEGLQFSNVVENGTNCIMENYTSLDLQNLAEITKSKHCNHDFFIVYLGPSNDSKHPNMCASHQYMCCSTKTLETYEYRTAIQSRVEKMLYEDVEACIKKWKAEDQALELKKPAKRTPNFRLVDIQGNPVEEDTDYLLQMYDQPEDVIKDGDYGSIFYATYRLNRSEKIVVRFCIIDGIHYLTYNGKFLQADDTNGDEIGYTEEEEVPEKNYRLEFHVTENNTFKTAKWDKNIWLRFEKRTLNHSYLNFSEIEEVMRWGKPLELMLKRV